MYNDIPENTVFELEKRLRQISVAIKKRGRKILTNYPITPSQFIALQWIVDEQDLTIGELAKKIGLAFSTTTDLINRMEANGLVERNKDERDRRIVRIKALDKGKQIIKEVIDERREYLGHILQSFTTEQTVQLTELLTHLYDTMHEEN
ncbi:DNA-binding MarR family transcriptional regulator [Cerasibacillus quisquiliarum]|uniref:MarR family winged helix-turn-helix transcriptional regulator n=1 Tax=Cerasibacillus quisquiliarum TaxID=227865 RepID=UPI0011BDDACD|nr:MarR family transcriptional regulator [Cerasibacillus quisquiliarum]MBB5145661.1 DNA-binding MarR family transcriptional regulator [Cerasibacillus quisquiliarum]